MSKAPAKSKTPAALNGKPAAAPTEILAADIRQLILEARTTAAAAVNASLTMLYWRVGQRIRRGVLGEKRAGYGDEILATLSRELTGEYGRGFSVKGLRHMLRFAEAFPDEAIVSALRRQLSWTHFRALTYLDEPQKRDFYAEMCRLEGWSTRTLQERIDSQLFERTALSRKPGDLIDQELKQLRDAERMSPALVLKNPYLLDFLGLADRYVEKDLEDAILREMEGFLLELGAGFSFVARQKRIQIDNDDFYIDLLFYNRRLKRLVAIELKLGDFKPEHKGQMELYLRWLAKYETEPGEAPPLGIILCTGKNRERIELLELDASSIHVAEYLTALPARELWAQRLHEAIVRSRARLENRTEGEE
jgi:predicted nuclease of restriction endonuclease-like (RecB) superfamily